MINTRQIITPQEAQHAEGVSFYGDTYLSTIDLVHTVATEPDRIAEAERRGAVKALREVAAYYHSSMRQYIDHRADAIENGADW